MGNSHRTPAGENYENRDERRVVDDLSPDYPVSAAELDAVEAFLMPLLNAILSDELEPPNTDTYQASTHNRREYLVSSDS